MNKTLELFDNLKELLKDRFILSEGATNSLTIIEKELKAYEKYKNIEEELKTDFLILAEAKKYGIYRRMADGIEFYPSYALIVYIDHIMTIGGKQLYPFEYKKLWAITKGELE